MKLRQSSKLRNALLLLGVLIPLQVFGGAAYDPTSKRLTLDTVSVGTANYNHVVVALESYTLLGVGSGAAAPNTFDPATQVLTLGSVLFQGQTYNNVRARLTAYTVLSADAAPGGDPATSVTPQWTGLGKTIAVAAGGDVQAAINAAHAGDTVELATGTWSGLALTINKKIRLKSAQPLGAVLQGHGAPSEGNDSAIMVTTPAASGSFIEGLDIQWYGAHCIGVQDTADVSIVGNRLQTCSGQAVFIYDTRDVQVVGNQILDPYTAGQRPTAIDVTDNTNWTFNNSLVLMDYGVQAYGTVGTRIEQNYFHGQFNQAVSFKEGNRDYSVIGNTFEGFTGTAVLFGQNVAQYGPYAVSGQTKSNDTGHLIASGNVFRPVVGLQDATPAEYRASGALRIGHLDDAAVTLSNNTIEGAITGIQVDMDVNGAPGGATGTLEIHHNIINGRVFDDGTLASPIAKMRNVGVQALQIKPGIAMAIAIHHETYINSAYAIQNLGATGSVSLDHSIIFAANAALYGSGTTQVSQSIFFNCAKDVPSGSNVSTVDPQFSGSTTVPLLRWTPRFGPPQSELSRRLQPLAGSPADLGGGNYIGAVQP